MKTVSIFIFLALFSALNYAQNDWMTFPDKTVSDSTVVYRLDFSRNGGTVNVYKDDRIDKIQEFTVADQGTVEGVKMDGYRVLIYFSQDKALSQQQKAHFMSLYPEHKAYIDFLAPNYRVRVGNFRTQLEAEALKAEILPIFPTAIVVEDKIQLPEIKSENQVSGN